MDRRLGLHLLPFAPLLLGILLLRATMDPAHVGALVLFPLASLAAIVGAALLPAFRPKRNWISGGVAFYLLGFFNLLLVLSIIVEVLALFTLFDLLHFELDPSAVWFVWVMPAAFVALQTLILVERRTHNEPPRWSRPVLVVAAAITAFDLLLWINALFAGHSRFLFVTSVPIGPGHAVYLVLTALTLQAVVAMVLFRIPTLIELVFFRDVSTGTIRALTNASPLMFTLAFAGISLGVSLFLILAADRVLGLGGVLPDNLLLRIALAFPVGVLTFFVVASVLTYKRGRPRYKHKLTTEDRILIAVKAGSVAVPLLLLLLAWRLSKGALLVGGILIPSSLSVEALVLAMLAATGPLGFYLQARNRRLVLVEERLPDLLNDLAETSKAGLPLHQSLASAARKDYGPLDRDIQRMNLQCSWGLSFAEAFGRFGDRSRSRFVKRAAQLVVETSRSGGNTGDVLSSTARELLAQNALRADRRAAMGTYIAVIYVVFFVFAAILAVLAQLFLPQLLASGRSAQESGASTALFSSSRVQLSAIKLAFFHALLVQAGGNGMIAGLIRDGNMAVGMRHAFLLTVFSWLAYRLVLA